jgi:hypothetical protein
MSDFTSRVLAAQGARVGWLAKVARRRTAGKQAITSAPRFLHAVKHLEEDNPGAEAEILSMVWPLHMPPTPKAVLVCLASVAQALSSKQGIEVPISFLCARTCFGRTAVIQAIDWLEKHGHIAVKRRTGRPARYTMTVENCSTLTSDARGE